MTQYDYLAVSGPTAGTDNVTEAMKGGLQAARHQGGMRKGGRSGGETVGTLIAPGCRHGHCWI